MSTRMQKKTVVGFGLLLALIVSAGAAAQDRAFPIASTVTTASQGDGGSILIARAIPEAVPVALRAQKLFPFVASIAQTIIQINRASGTITLFQDGRVAAKYSVQGADKIQPGSYKIVHKQRHPLWQAPDEYFVNRKLPVPASGDPRRVLKGALGEFALFTDTKVPLHSGATYAKEVGGLRLDDASLAQLYYKVGVGTQVVVQ